MKRILVPIDFSEASLNGLRYAFNFARKTKGEIHLFHALNPVPVVADNISYDDLSELEEISKEKLEKICEQLTSANTGGIVNYMFHVTYGFAEDEILRVIKGEKIDLVVMGTRGQENSPLIGGPLSADIARRAQCPVMIIPAGYHFSNIGKIAFASDLTGDENPGINFVIGFAKAFEAHVFFLNIQKKEPDNVQDIISAGFNLLNANEYKDMSFHVLEKEDIIEGIQYFVGKENVDLIVMSTYKRKLFERIFEKSHTKKLVAQTEIPLLAMHKERKMVKV
jgi:nucleotide-binding universal stress UspA family protein